MHQEWQKPYKAIYKIFRRYWRVYGGFKSLVYSPYLHLSILLFLLTWPFWDFEKDGAWFDFVLAITPSMLGFTLGGYAILLAFGNEAFQKAISGDDHDGSSPFITIIAAFTNFLILQIIALLLAIVFKAWGVIFGPLAWLGFLVFLYSVSSALAAVMAVFQLSDWFNKFNEDDNAD
ncbi:MAG: hypothetical protein PHI97_19255 [Desulfobulbus sp.]|nr:hypothetical protein [Desulfobulbus sp.]